MNKIISISIITSALPAIMFSTMSFGASHTDCYVKGKQCVAYVKCREPLFNGLSGHANKMQNSAQSWAEYKKHNHWGVGSHLWGYGGVWDDKNYRFPLKGYYRLNKPEVGAAITFDSPSPYGHVVYVDKVINNREISISHSNWSGLDGTGKKATTSGYWNDILLSGLGESMRVYGIFKPVPFWARTKHKDVKLHYGNSYQHISKNGNFAEVSSRYRGHYFKLEVPYQNYGSESWSTRHNVLEVLDGPEGTSDSDIMIDKFIRPEKRISPLETNKFVFTGKFPESPGRYTLWFGMSGIEGSYGHPHKLSILVY